jgi:hypothetical protein
MVPCVVRRRPKTKLQGPHSLGIYETKFSGHLMLGALVCVSVFPTLLRQVNLLCVFWAPDSVRSGRNIYIGSGRTSLLPVIGGLRYQHH